MPESIVGGRTAETASASVKRTQLDLPSWLRDELSELAESKELSLSDYIRIVLMDHVNAQKRQSERP
jgi:hypothetical protein